MSNHQAMQRYHAFVRERHTITQARAAGTPYQTSDPVLAGSKFCCVYRVLDFGSQWFIKELLHSEEVILTPEDVLYRAMLYRYYNRPDPFVWFKNNVGRYPLAIDRSGLAERAWTAYDRAGGTFFGNAYTMFSGAENPGVRRWQWALGLAGQALDEVAYDFLKSYGTQAQAQALLPLPRVGSFMAQQVVTDFNYSFAHRGSENDFVFDGPGSRRGAERLGWTGDIDSLARFLQPELLDLVGPACRVPSLMDIQNTLCEFDKYERWSAKPPRTKYTPKHHWQTPEPVLPKHWL